jgi:hypothetical protein
MRDDHFEAVRIETDQPGRHVNVTSVRQVAERLTDKWPSSRQGVAYNRAVKACMDHFSGKRNIEAVRAAFIEAAKDAGIFVREGHREE